MRHTASWLFTLHVLLAVLLSGWSTSLLADHPSTDYQSMVNNCIRNPANRIGGAAVGICLENEVNKLDTHIEEKVRDIGAKLCLSNREQLLQTQQQWLTYRQSFCQLLPTIHDNTAMYINSHACALRLSLTRHGDLNYFKNNLPVRVAPCP